jgi:hypothetical protein
MLLLLDNSVQSEISSEPLALTSALADTIADNVVIVEDVHF